MRNMYMYFVFLQDRVGGVEDGVGRNASRGWDAPAGSRHVHAADRRAAQDAESRETASRQKSLLTLQHKKSQPHLALLIIQLMSDFNPISVATFSLC